MNPREYAKMMNRMADKLQKSVEADFPNDPQISAEVEGMFLRLNIAVNNAFLCKAAAPAGDANA